MLLLTVNVPRSRTALPGVSETSGSVRNSHSASNGVIPPEKAEGRGWASVLCQCFICDTTCFHPTSCRAREGSLKDKGWEREKKTGREQNDWGSYRTMAEKAVSMPVWNALWFPNIFRLFFMSLLGLKRPCRSQILFSSVFQSELPWGFCLGLENMSHLLPQALCWCCLLNARAWAVGTQEISGPETKPDPSREGRGTSL